MRMLLFGMFVVLGLRMNLFKLGFFGVISDFCIEYFPGNSSAVVNPFLPAISLPDLLEPHLIHNRYYLLFGFGII